MAPPSGRSPFFLLPLVRCLRPKQWIKNALIFAPGIFASRTSDRWLFSPGVLSTVGTTFLLFSVMAGCTYIINDYVDLERDRNNPSKRHRPMAAGEISPGVALGFALLGIVSI